LVYRLVRQFTTSVGRSGRDEFRIKQIFRDLWGIFIYWGILPETTWIQKYHVCQSWTLFLCFRRNCGRRNFFRRPILETKFTSKEPLSPSTPFEIYSVGKEDWIDDISLRSDRQKIPLELDGNICIPVWKIPEIRFDVRVF